MTHYGIRNKATGRWLMNAAGDVFATTGRLVAEAQFEQSELCRQDSGTWSVERFDTWRKRRDEAGR